MSFRHEIISFKMMDRLVDYWNSNSVLWHIERSLKLTADGAQPHTSEGRGGVSPHQVNCMGRFQR